MPPCATFFATKTALGFLAQEQTVCRVLHKQASPHDAALSPRLQVVGQEYAQAFLAKTAEVFDRNAELEQDNRILREENAALRVAAEEAARRWRDVA